MKKLLLLFLLFLLSVNSYAGAICNDGWISKSSGSGTCSWHGGVKKWLNKKESSDKYEDIYSPDNGVVGKCKGTYQQKEICRNSRRLIQQEYEDSLKQSLKYEKTFRDSIRHCDSSACAEKILEELLKDL